MSSGWNKGKFDTKSPDAKLNVEAHRVSDVDLDENSFHHTLGKGAFQAAAGNHTHSFTTNGETLTLEELFATYLSDTGDVTMASWFATGYKSFSVATTCFIRKIGQDVSMYGTVSPNAGNFASGVLVDVFDTIPEEWLPRADYSWLVPVDLIANRAQVILYGTASLNKQKLAVLPSAAAPYAIINVSWRLAD